MSIEVKEVTKIYGEQKAVNNISFQVNQGEIVGFLGPNGAGKSTTMKMITGYLPPTSGTILVSGIDVAKNGLETKKRCGYLPESNALYYDMYIREYLYFIANLHSVQNTKKRTEEVIELVGLTPEHNKKIAQLSKGYKQRVGLAAALIHNPDVLILDEPTSGLDPNQIVEIRNVIKEQGKNKLVLFSSHILGEVEAICDRVIIINKGTIVANDELKALQNRSAVAHVKVGFSEPLEKEWLNRLPGAQEVTKIDLNNWSIKTAEPEKVRKALLDLTLQHNLNIVSLQTGSESLEEIFRSLTASPVMANEA